MFLPTHLWFPFFCKSIDLPPPPYSRPPYFPPSLPPDFSSSTFIYMLAPFLPSFHSIFRHPSSPFFFMFFFIMRQNFFMFYCVLFSVMVWWCGNCWQGKRHTRASTRWQWPTVWQSTNSHCPSLPHAQRLSGCCLNVRKAQWFGHFWINNLWLAENGNTCYNLNTYSSTLNTRI